MPKKVTADRQLAVQLSVLSRSLRNYWYSCVFVHTYVHGAFALVTQPLSLMYCPSADRACLVGFKSSAPEGLMMLQIVLFLHECFANMFSDLFRPGTGSALAGKECTVRCVSVVQATHEQKILLMIEILHHLTYKNFGNSGSMVYLGSWRNFAANS